MLDLKTDLVSQMVKDKIILITGGTGSFGNQITKVLLEFEHQPKKIIIFSRDEFKQHLMQKSFPPSEFPNLRYFLGDVRDYKRLKQALNDVDIVFHAAALKRIDMLEYNPEEGIKTNVLGTQNLVNAALKNQVEKVILVSTDKATSPANLYGATKLCAERIIISANAMAGENGTVFGVLRYGNVFNSRGSVVPIFREQAKTGTLTLTDPKMTRFTITLTEAINFVLNSAALMMGGEIFIPKLASYRVDQLADLIAPDAIKKEIGLRPGEKMHESMISADEGHQALDCGAFYVIQPIIKYHRDCNYMRYYTGLGYSPKECSMGFSYSSDQNEMIPDQDLRDLL